MKATFVESLWNKSDMLHERYKNKYDSTLNFIDLIATFRYLLKQFSSMINNFLNKNSSLNLSLDSTWDLTQLCLKSFLSVISKEFEQLSTTIKEKESKRSCFQIVDIFSHEKELLLDCKKTISRYNDAKIALEKERNRFENSAKVAEMAMTSAKNLEWYSLACQVEKNKNYTKAMALWEEAKENELKYMTSIENANKWREESIKKEKRLLNLYSKIDNIIYSDILEWVSLIYEGCKKVLSAITCSLEELPRKINRSNIKNEIHTFIENNKSNESPEEEIQFIPYAPITKEVAVSLDKEDLTYQVIKELKLNWTMIYPNYNWIIEENKLKLKYWTRKLFTPNHDFVFSDEQKEELWRYIKENKDNRMIFWMTVNLQRIKGKFCRQMKFIQDLKEIINLIWDFSVEDNNYECSRNCLILSQTFYYEDKETGSKVYIFNLIRDNKWLATKEFWEEQIEYQIEEDIKKYETQNDQAESETDKRKRNSRIAFSQVLPYTNNMLAYKMSKEMILDIICKFVSKYEIEKDMSDPIVNNVKEKEYE